MLPLLLLFASLSSGGSCAAPPNFVFNKNTSVPCWAGVGRMVCYQLATNRVAVRGSLYAELISGWANDSWNSGGVLLAVTEATLPIAEGNCYPNISLSSMTIINTPCSSWVSPSENATLLALCNVPGCHVLAGSMLTCWFRPVAPLALGVVGIVSCITVLVLFVVVVYHRVWLRIVRGQVSLLVVLLWIGLAALLFLDVAFWVIFLMDVFYPLDARSEGGALRVALRVLEKITLLLSVGIYAAHLWDWMQAWHANRLLVSRIGWVMGMFCFLIGAGTLGLMVAYELNFGTGDALVVELGVALYVLLYGSMFILSACFVVYGVLLLKAAQSPTKGLLFRFVLVLVAFVGCSLLRAGISSYCWLRSFGADSDWVNFPGTSLVFESVSIAIVFYVAVFIIPDVIPPLVILYLLVGVGVTRGADKGQRWSQHEGRSQDTPLLRVSQRTSGAVPARYDL